METNKVKSESKAKSEIGGISGDDGAAVVDSTGAAFDSGIHVMDKAGAPKKNKDGTFRMRPGGAGKRGAVQSGVPAEQLQHSAKFCVMAVTGLATSIGGEAWRAEPAEEDFLKMATANYMESKGTADIPPGILLAIAFLSYSAASYQRMETKPDVTGKVKRFFGWFRRRKKVEPVVEKEPEKV